MEIKDLNKVLDYLPVIRTVYSEPNWGGKNEYPIDEEVVCNFRIFWDILCKNIPLKHILKPSFIFPYKDGSIGIEWEKINESPYFMDLFYIYVTPDSTLIFESNLESLGTSIQRECELKEELDEQLLIHIKHFN